MDARRAVCCLVLLYMQLLTALAGLERTCTLSDFYEGRRVQSRVSCSRRLPELIKQICRGAINIPRGFAMPGRHGRDTASVVGGSDGIFIDKMAASKYLTKRDLSGGSSGTQGIVCECCVHPCRRSELRQYCAAGSRTRRSDALTATVRDGLDDALIRKFYGDLGASSGEAAAPWQQRGGRRSATAAASKLDDGAPASDLAGDRARRSL